MPVFSIPLEQAQKLEDLFERADALFLRLGEFEPKLSRAEDAVVLAALCDAGRKASAEAVEIFAAKFATAEGVRT